ncbi:C-reactive protein-like [Nematolebias whitei]|uniref:C-reactive protein-like n=1 Tax=Nematolebias whitei TaxID=451745 RepID=UPI001896DBCC|nr:C-reactive protein-like [Nematolebias whitei]
MKLLLVLVMLTASAAKYQDLSGKMFTFPLETNTAHVRLNPSSQNFEAVTVCYRFFTDIKRDHSLFSLATPLHYNELLVYWDGINKVIDFAIKNKEVFFSELDYKTNIWHSICTTWDSESGLVQLWFDGQPFTRKYVNSGATIAGPVIIIIGQEQDSYGGDFDVKQSFTGMMSDVHMWNYTLYPCDIQNYVDGLNFTPGNVLNWRALDFQIVDKVLIEHKITHCY